MAVLEVQKVNIVGHKKDKSKIVNALYDFGAFEISDWKTSDIKEDSSFVDEKVSEIDARLSEIQSAIKFLESYKAKEKFNLQSKLAGSAITISPAKVKEVVKNVDVNSKLKEIKSLDENINKNKSRLDSLLEEKGLLGGWIGIDGKITDLFETRLTRGYFGIVNSDRYPELEKKLNEKVSQSEIIKISSKDQQDNLVVIFRKKFEKRVNTLLQEFGFEKIELPQVEYTPSELIQKIKADRVQLRKELKDLKRLARKTSKEHLENLKILFDYFTWRSRKLSAEKEFSNTSGTFSIAGWLVKNDIDTLRKGLSLVSNNYEIEELKKGKDEKEPIIIKNSNFITPFEAVTNIYGLPGSNDVDPTPFLAIFFIIFFGLCLTDAGYGLVLMIVTYLAIKIMKIPRENQRLIRLLMYGGFVTFIIGALTGGWFGIVLEDLPEGAISNFLIKIRLIDPIKDPIVMLILSFILGFIQIWVGIAIDMWWKIKNKHVMDGILDSGTWLYFLGSVAFWAMTTFGALPASLSKIALYMVYSGVALLILTQGRKQKNIFMKFFAGVGSLYGLIGYISDILSYSRLLALGLATAVIAMVINLIATLFRDMVPVVGWAVMILILIGGHLFNIVINVLGAYIHSGRLQFVEFFPKFFAGGGKIFRPFRRESKYVKLTASGDK